MVDVLRCVDAEWNEGQAPAASDPAHEAAHQPRQHPSPVVQHSLNLFVIATDVYCDSDIYIHNTQIRNKVSLTHNV